MKKITSKGLLPALLIGVALSASAQTPEQKAKIISHYNVEASHKLAAELKERAAAEKAEAVRLANLNGWPLTITEKDGTFKELKKVNNGKPVYFTTSNAGSAITSRVNKIHTGGGAGYQLDGQGMTIGIWDGGKVRDTHNDLKPRVTQMDGATEIIDHATHVSGTMMGSGEFNANAKGMAPEASLLAQDWNFDTTEMIERAVEDALLISNHSYGRNANSIDDAQFGAYNEDSRDWDVITYEHPYYQPVVAAGNDREGYQTYNPNKFGRDLLSDQAVSKNVVVVAAIPAVTDFTELDIQTASFSNWGPSDDGRVKPDISAKGLNVTSTWGTSNSAYSAIQGTSMASPGIAGTLLLLQQHYGNLHDEFMRSATLRGLMIHTADDASYPLGPDFKTGWGIMDAEDAVNLLTEANAGGKAIVEELTLTQGSTYTKTIIANGNEPLKVTVSWTDPAGPIYTGNNPEGGANALVNNLNVTLTKVNGNVVNYPWRLNTSFVTDEAQQNVNNVDNVEKIELAMDEFGEIPLPAANDQYTVTVTGNFGTGYSAQDFSLIVSGVSSSTAGIDDNAVDNVKMWPNPANDVLYISLADMTEGSSIAIYDVQGREVVAKKPAGDKLTSIDISALSSGIYVVEIVKGNTRTSKKMVKK